MGDVVEAEFGGKTFNEQRDGKRLKAQLDRVRSAMFDGAWLTLAEISTRLSTVPPTPEASISARLRDLRKPKFGGYDVQKRIRTGHRALWEYHINYGGAHGKTAAEQGGAP